MKRNRIPLLLTSLLLLSLLTVPALASPGEVSCGEKNDVVLASNKDGDVSIRVTGLVAVTEQAELTVEYGADVTSCPYPAEEILSLTTTENVIGIADGVFRDCVNLARLSLHEDTASIGANAFAGCTALGSLELGAGVTSLGDGAFAGCSALTAVTLADDMELADVGEGVFEGCPVQTITAGGSWKHGEKQEQLAKLFPEFDLSMVSYGKDGGGVSMPVLIGVGAAVVIAVVVVAVAKSRGRYDEE